MMDAEMDAGTLDAGTLDAGNFDVGDSAERETDSGPSKVDSMNVGVIGAGYVGLVQAAGLAHLGHRVRLAEASRERLADLESGRIPIFEAGLDALIRRAVENDLLTFHGDNTVVGSESEVIFLCLPTPPGVDGAADITIVERVAREIAELPGEPVLVIKSTVPVGTCMRLEKRLAGKARIVSNPEFLREGSAVEDFLHPDRIVVGSKDDVAGDAVEAVYASLDTKIVRTDLTSAELIKYGSNSYLAARLTFVNALANIAESVGADILDVVEGMGHDRRIGSHFLRPGPGYGGSCFPKDTIALLATSRQAGYEFTLLQTVVDADRSQRHWIVGNIRRMVGGDLSGQRIAMWGVAFKAGTDDTRESPAIKIAHMLASEGATVVAYDPEAVAPEPIEMAPDPISAAERAEVLLVATEWPEFTTIGMDRVAEVMHGQMVYDVRNLLDHRKVEAAGLRYHGLGRLGFGR